MRDCGALARPLLPALSSVQVSTMRERIALEL
jgi:hypothetical protein